eukprot:scaffold239057_cov32-Tisochrysis_lutea.AAC.2
MLTAGIIVAGWDEEKGGQVFALPIGGALLPRDYATGGSGSTYIYGFCDAFYKKDMTRAQCEEFVTKGECVSRALAALSCLRARCGFGLLPSLNSMLLRPSAGLCHAMARDGSSGGVIRLAIIEESGVERKFIPGNKLPYGPL